MGNSASETDGRNRSPWEIRLRLNLPRRQQKMLERPFFRLRPNLFLESLQSRRQLRAQRKEDAVGEADAHFRRVDVDVEGVGAGAEGDAGARRSAADGAVRRPEVMPTNRRHTLL